VNYSGKYSAEQPKNGARRSSDSTLEVVQNEDSVEVTKVEQGKRTTYRCPFNGSDGEYASPTGVPGRCKAQLKGKSLNLEIVVVARPQPTATVHIHTNERWQLSPDGKTLTIKEHVDFPDVSPEISDAVAPNTVTTTYTRNENP